MSDLPDLLSQAKSWWRNNQRERAEALHAELKYVVQTDENKISVSHPNGDVQVVAWDAIQTIAIHTNDGGPYVPDFGGYLKPTWRIAPGPKAQPARKRPGLAYSSAFLTLTMKLSCLPTVVPRTRDSFAGSGKAPDNPAPTRPSTASPPLRVHRCGLGVWRGRGRSGRRCSGARCAAGS